MKKILYLLCSCFAVTLMASCEDFLDKTPQGDKTDQDIFSRFNETESLINRLYFYARAADQPLVHIRFFSDSALTDECEGSSAENGWSNKFNDGVKQRRPLGHVYHILLLGPNSTKTSAAPTSSSKVSRSTTPRIPRHAPARFRSVSARCSSSAPTCTTAC